MIENIFGFLESIGFTHPLHPAFTHLPMGMVMGAVVFRMASLVPKFRSLAKTGYYCVVLGLLGTFPTILTGLMDWQYRFAGQWEFLIILKMILAGAMVIVLSLIALKDDSDQPKLNNMTFLYFFTLLIAIGLGFSGGELVYG